VPVVFPWHGYLRRDERRKCTGENRLSSKSVILGLLLVHGFASAIYAASDFNERDYSISYGSAPENTGKARALIQRDIEQMRSGEISPDELHQAKAFLLRQIPLSASSEEEVAEDLLDRAELGLPLDEDIREVGKYLDVSASEIRAAFAKRIRPEDFVQVVRGPSF
jgi:predicted Zn-dependent peptidase